MIESLTFDLRNGLCVSDKDKEILTIEISRENQNILRCYYSPPNGDSENILRCYYSPPNGDSENILRCYYIPPNGDSENLNAFLRSKIMENLFQKKSSFIKGILTLIV